MRSHRLAILSVCLGALQSVVACNSNNENSPADAGSEATLTDAASDGAGEASVGDAAQLDATPDADATGQ